MSDLDYRYLRCNEAFCRFLGYPERELVGRSVLDVTHPEDRHTRSVVRELVDGKTGQAQFQKRYIRRDGSVVWGDVTVRLVRSPEGVPRHMLSVVQDITERVLNAQEKEKLEAQLQHYIESASGAIVADPTQMQQVLMNLCTNAAHAMEREGGILQIRMADVELGASDVRFGGDLKPGRYVRVTVTDTGHGIDPAVIQRIFEPYFTTKEKGKGTGLGLAVVHGIVTAHNGAITVSSEPGKGTTFEVFLPCAEGYARRPAHARAPSDRDRTDSAGRRRGRAARYRPADPDLLGYTVEATTSPLEALAAFQAAPHAFDLVLTDMTMPQMTGLKMAGRMMELRPDIPVIICTGFSDQVNPQQAHAAGIKALLMKPLMVRELAEAIRQALEKS